MCAWQMWPGGLTKGQTDALEAVQKCALPIISRICATVMPWSMLASVVFEIALHSYGM